MLPDGRLASGSYIVEILPAIDESTMLNIMHRDHLIRLYDASTGAETGRLEGNSDKVTALVA